MAITFPVRFLKCAEAARAYSLSPETLRKLVREKRLTGYRPDKGKGILLDVTELEAMFAASASK